MLSWDLVGKLLWNLDPEMFDHMEILAEENDWHFNYFLDAYSHFQGYSLVITDKDLNIQCCSENIKKMTGYENYELIGHQPRILQGHKTDSNSKLLIKKAIQKELPFTARLVNYRKNEEAYGCEIHAFPIFNGKSELSHFIAFETEYFV
ncbi:PAS domain-containing protein [Nonlabens sp.]|uniref:PAS domain-containing protein n=1 Tax=Nonlabens sp. TaxID=1888209 RepID=UPI003F4AD769